MMRIFIAIVLLGLLSMATAGADVESVYVDPSIPNSSLVADRIAQRLLPGDDIIVAMFPVGGNQYRDVPDDMTLLTAIGNDVSVHASGWPDQIWLEQKLIRVNAVASTGTDRILAMIREIHQWQALHPKPLPPTPPTSPEPPFDWAPWIIASSIFMVLGNLIYLMLRRRRRIARLREAADRPVDIPTLDDYLKGMNT